MAFEPELDLYDLDGTNGFVINGIDSGDYSSGSVSSAGDINGDGFDDLIIGAHRADPNGNNYAGESYVVFGSNQPFDAELNLSSLDGTNGFVINGIDSGDRSGDSVSSAGDVNGDGFDDLIIGAYSASPNGTSGAGESYVVFGSDQPFDSELNLASLDGTNGFVINGIDAGDVSGFSVSSAGDINSDGFDDLIIGAHRADPNGNDIAGESYVVFGSNQPFDAELNLSSLDGTNGFVINGIDADDYSGRSVSSAGDINGDGFDDLIIGADRADPNGNISAGESYVVFGSDQPFDSELNLASLDGTNGFVINGIDADDRSGYSVSSAGDINGDGFDDLIIGARGADPNGQDYAGESYVVFGSNSPNQPRLNLSQLDGTNGFVLNGIDSGDRSGRSVSSAGDINSDGFDDLIIGAPGASPTIGAAGESYVVFGSNQPFDPELNLSQLDGTNGFVLLGIDSGDYSGRSVSSAGDINGDGFDDLIMGARYASPNGNSYAGKSYVVFGSVGPFGSNKPNNSELDLASLDGTNGFVINGIDSDDFSGRSVSSAGDVNGDGFDDLIIGAFLADPNGINGAGESYVVFGSDEPFDAELNLSSLDGTNGFVINGIDADDRSGYSVSSAGDINGDGFDDLIIGAFLADPNGQDYAGESYVVFGSDEPFDPGLNLASLDGTNGFVINGIDANDGSGDSVSSAGDINGDGFDDLIIGAFLADPNGINGAGESYVVFGSDEPFDSELNLASLDGTNGFVINGIDANDGSGDSVSSAGDINGDGFDDLIIGSPGASPNGNNSVAGESYVVFGSDGPFDPELNLSSLDGTNGFVINGIDSFDLSGLSVSSAGDFNGDGFDDLIIGAYRAHPNGNNSAAGESYVVFGSDGPNDPELNLSQLDGTNGFVINGIDSYDRSGWSVSSAGDFNGDGFDDLIIGAYSASPNGISGAGESYVVFGSDGPNDPELNLASLDGTNGFVINGIDSLDYSGWSVSSAGDINGDGFDDLIIGARGADPNGISGAGESYVVFGRANNRTPVANDDSFTTDEDISLSASVFTDNGNGADNDPDGDNLTVTAVNGIAANVGSEVTLASGALLTLNADGNFDYNPNGQFELLNNGETDTDSFTYSIDDGNGATANATVSVTINGVNDAPIGNPDSVSTFKDTALTIAVSYLLANDTDVDNASIQIIGVSNASNGSVTIDDNGTATDKSDDSIIFDPQNEFSGIVTFDYIVSDGDLSSTTTVTVDVEIESGTAGSDSLIGGSGNDEIFGLAGEDFIDGRDGSDFLSGGDGDDFVLAGNGNDTLSGGHGDDFLLAGNGNDRLSGGIGDDFLLGGDGNDFLMGGIGDDFLIGGEGTDTFVVVAGGVPDTISDFNNNDDLIGLAYGLGFSDLTFSGNKIMLTDSQDILAFLTGVNTETLTEANFVLV